MADARARDGHTSDCRTTSAIVCVCACRLPLKMQVWPATSGVKDTPKRYVHGVAACDCGSHLSSQQRALGSRGSGSLRSGAQSSVTHGSWVRDGTALGLQVCSWEVKKERGDSDVSPTANFAVCRVLQRQFRECSHVYSPHKNKKYLQGHTVTSESPVLTPAHLVGTNGAWWRSIGPIL
jgi:hypothetical protein